MRDCLQCNPVLEHYYANTAIYRPLTLLVGRLEGHPARKNMGDGGGHWLVQMEWYQPNGQCVCLC